MSLLMDKSTVIMAAMNSSRFIEARSWRFLGSMYLHACPWLVKPPSPHSQASEKVVEVILVVHILLILTPVVCTCEMKNFQSLRSSKSHGANFILNLLCLSLFLRSRYLSRVRKYLLIWMMVPT
jgi:hypothetical protein